MSKNYEARSEGIKEESYKKVYPNFGINLQ